MSTQEQINRVCEKLQDALSGVREELAKCRSGQSAVDSEATLQWMAEGLQQMLASLDTGERITPPKLWYPISDQWPRDVLLGHKITDAEHWYERLK